MVSDPNLLWLIKRFLLSAEAGSEKPRREFGGAK